MSRDFVRTISGIQTSRGAVLLNRINIDFILLPLICAVLLFGLLVLRSASNGDEGVILSQSIRIGLGFFNVGSCTNLDIFSSDGRLICICFLFFALVSNIYRRRLRVEKMA